VYKNGTKLGKAFENNQNMKKCGVIYPTVAMFDAGDKVSFVQFPDGLTSPEANASTSSVNIQAQLDSVS